MAPKLGRGSGEGAHYQPEWCKSHWVAGASCQTLCKWEASLSGELAKGRKKKTVQGWASLFKGEPEGLRAVFGCYCEWGGLYCVSWGKVIFWQCQLTVLLSRWSRKFFKISVFPPTPTPVEELVYMHFCELIHGHCMENHSFLKCQWEW